MQNPLDDNQAKSSFYDHPLEAATEIFPDEELPHQGPGCGMFGLIGVLVILISLLIVGFSGAAGWTSGQREANMNATATQNTAVNDQMALIPQEIANRNTELLAARLNYVATLAPNAPGLAEYMVTATALMIELQPTATSSPTPTIEAIATTPAPEATVEAAFTPSGDGNTQLAEMLQQAQNNAAAGQWEDAIDWLEAINALDPTYESATVRQLLTETMNSYALFLYQSNNAARANSIVARMESLGITLREGLSYERDVAGLFLSAQAAAAAGDPRALTSLQEIINLGAGGRYYALAQQELSNYYIRYGDQLAGDPNAGFCPAAVQYQNALNVFSSGTASSKLSYANSMCAQATPTPDPLLGVDPNQTPVAPIGVPGT